MRKIIALSLVIVMNGCDWSDVDAAKNKLSEWGAPSTDEVSEVATAEWNKLFGIEYKVEHFAAGAAVKDIETVLQGLGKDRWDCFQLERRGDELLAFCKRIPQSYLRYLSKAF